MRWCPLLAVVLAACGVSETNTRDSGFVSVRDGGHDSTPRDSGLVTFDAGSAAVRDAGLEVEADAGQPRDAGEAPICGRCTAYGSATNAGTIMVGALVEASGLAASRAHPGVLYSHNDSGGQPSIYITNTSGADLGELALTGAANADWEDIAVGPCAAGWCIYAGEIGDNNKVNPGPYAIYRVAEPRGLSAGHAIGRVEVSFERLPLRYPNNEKYNAETMMVHPVSGDVYVVTKADLGQKSSAYKVSAPLNTTNNDLVKLRTLSIPDGLDQITAGSIDACGTTMLIRSYGVMYQFTVSESAPFDSIFSNGYTKVPAPAFPLVEKQGEAVTFGPLGGYYTVSEGTPALHFFGCR